ncbi:uncharacterized protein LOC126550454 isoform X2 [Aphis gossypii]|uniref:uncharacterized protein LOC126550454 isoform X2 n=1 Tax=Aphis gossypii TaxID=80765 RepID=UPI00215925A1|nr:uncharacterized protein LOC126550454 isoform X2 [Aphis gossypii]
MGFAVNVEHLIQMAIDARNKHINHYFLIRLLEVVVRHTNLNKFYVDFTGSDQNRAQDVYTGIHDSLTIPLNDDFEVTFDEEYDGFLRIERPRSTLKRKARQCLKHEDFEESGMLEMSGEYDDNPTVSIQTLSTQKEVTEDAETYERSVSIEECKKKSTNSIETEAAMHDTIKMMQEQLNALTLRFNEFQITQNVTTSNLTLPDPENDPESINECEGESFEALSIEFEYNSISTFSSEPEIIKEIEEEKPPFNVNTFLEEQKEYYIYNNDRNVIEEIMEHLLNENKNLCCAMQKFKKSIKDIPNDNYNDYENEEIDIEQKFINSDIDSLFTVKKRKFDPTKQEDNLKRLDISSKGEVYLDIFGRRQKRKDLFLPLSIRDFREFDLDYRTNFQIMLSFFESYNKKFEKDRRDIEELQKSFVHKEKYLRFKEAVMSTHNEIKDQIREYIIKDPEASGIVRFIKEGACISCGRPAIMKTTNSHPIYCNMPPNSNEKKRNQKSEGVKTPKPMNTYKQKESFLKNVPICTSMHNFPVPTTVVPKKKKEELEYELDRMKNDYKNQPLDAKDLILLEKLTKQFNKGVKTPKPMNTYKQKESFLKNVPICTSMHNFPVPTTVVSKKKIEELKYELDRLKIDYKKYKFILIITILFHKIHL